MHKSNFEFLTYDPKIKAILKGLSLTSSLFVSSIIIGKTHTGKKTIVRNIFPKAIFVDSSKPQEVKEAFENYSEIVLYNFENIKNLQELDFNNKRVVAIATEVQHLNIDDKFAFIYHLPELKDRLLDVDLLINKFTKSIKKELMVEKEITIDNNNIDLSKNIKSLKNSIYKQILYKNISKEDIEEILFEYFMDTLDGKNGYQDNLDIFEKPLIKAGLQKFKSQLKLSIVLGINRNTLRKKISEHDL
jgi:DNA-binding protein Fis